MRSKVIFSHPKWPPDAILRQNFQKKEKLCIDLKWQDMRSKVIFSNLKKCLPCGSGAFQMLTCSASASTLGGGKGNLRNASVTFSLFCHEASLG